VSQVILDEPQIVAAIGKVEAARMAQHVWVDRWQLGPSRGHADQIIHGLAGERLLALRQKSQGNESVRVAR
jgi:hypothetical protein